MLESDAGRLSSIKRAGGQVVRFDRGELWAIFDATGVRMQFEETQVNSTDPELTVRTSDVERLNIKRSDAAEVEGKNFTVREVLPGDAPGWHSIILDSA